MPNFDITKSQFTQEKIEKLRDEKFTGNLNAITGIGPKSVQKLREAEEPILDAYQLLGRYLSFQGRDLSKEEADQAFFEWYAEATGQTGHAHKVTTHLMFGLHFGLEDIEMELNDNVKANVGYEQYKAFMDNPLSGDLNDIPGVGAKTVEKLEDIEITSSWQLCGAFLKTRNMGQFQAMLKEMELPAAWVQTVAYLIALKCRNGLKKEGAIQDLTAMLAGASLDEEAATVTVATTVTVDVVVHST